MSPAVAFAVVLCALAVAGTVVITVLALADRAGVRRYAATVAWWAALTGAALALAFVDSGNVRT